jgi:hypothetical protein
MLASICHRVGLKSLAGSESGRRRNTNPTSGTMRLSFKAAPGESFEVIEGQELVLAFDTELVPVGRFDFLIR